MDDHQTEQLLTMDGSEKDWVNSQKIFEYSALKLIILMIVLNHDFVLVNEEMVKKQMIKNEKMEIL